MAKDDAKQAKGGTSPPGSESLGLQWLDDVAAHDFDAALAYLSLKLDEKQAAAAVGRLRKAQVTRRRANDILRACSLVPLPLDDPGVRRDLFNAVSGKQLSPVLVISTVMVVTSPTGTTGSPWRTTSTPSVTSPCALAPLPPDPQAADIVHPTARARPRVAPMNPAPMIAMSMALLSD